MTTRRGFLFGLTGLFAAPAIVRASSLMELSPVPDDVYRYATFIANRPQDYLLGTIHGRSPIEGLVMPLPDADILTGIRHSRSGTPISAPLLRSPRMTMAQIDRWNQLRSHTGLRMEPILT